MIADETAVVSRILGSPPEVAPHPKQELAELPVGCTLASGMGDDVVRYTFRNPEDRVACCVLYRGVTGVAPAYYFGNAFGPGVYYGKINGSSAAYYYDKPEPVPPVPPSPRSTEYALGVLDVPGGLVCFLFVLPPLGSVSAYEARIPDCGSLSDVHAYKVTISHPRRFCVEYSRLAVSQYAEQTGYKVSPPKNPYTVTTVLMRPVAKTVPQNQVFAGQSAQEGSCP